MKNHHNPLSKIVAVALTVALIAMMVTPAFAADDVLTAENEITSVGAVTKLYRAQPSFDAYPSAAGNTFNTTVTGYLKKVAFNMFLQNYSATDTFVLRARVEECADTLNHIPDDTLVEDSADYLTEQDISSAAYTRYELNFTGLNQLQANTKYAVYVYLESASGLSSNDNVWVGGTNGNPYIGYSQHYHNLAWQTPGTVFDIQFEVWVNVDAGGGSTPTIPVVGGTWDNFIESFTAFIVPVFVLLLPAILLMFLTRKTDKWLLLIGITIGAGLGYYFGLVPLWLVFLITIGLIGMAYQSVRGGNS